MTSGRPGSDPFTTRTPRVVAARRLQRRRERTQARRFLAEGPQAVREAGPAVVELFGTPDALDRHGELVDSVAARGARVSPVTEEALAALADTVQPQGLVAVCAFVDVPLPQALATGPRLVAVLAGIRDPGNAGTVLRTADAAGAGAVVFAGDAVDPYNGKCVRASAGSLFHVDVVRAPEPAAVLRALHDAGYTVYAADAHGALRLDDAALDGPVAWVFGSEAHGLPADLAGLADAGVRVPIHGRAESLNLAAAAAVCLYASAMRSQLFTRPAGGGGRRG